MTETAHIPTIDELIEFPDPSDAQIAPDGKHVAYAVETPDWQENEHVARLWLADVETGEIRQLTFAGQSSTSARWSPDGQWLAFLSKRSGDEHTQIYRLSPFGGEAERLTESEGDISALAWAPDGQSIAYIATDAETPELKERREKYGDYRVEDEDYVRAHLWLLSLASKKARKLTTGKAYHVRDMDWKPDSQALAFAAWPTPEERDFDHGRIYLIEVNSLAVRMLAEGGCARPRWSPDGQQIAFVRAGSPSYYGNSRICTVGIAGGAPQVISQSFDEDPWLQDWRADGIYFNAVQRTAIHLFRLDPATGAHTRLTPDNPGGWVSLGASVSTDGSRAAMVAADANHVAEVALLDLASGEVRRLTDFNSCTAEWQLGTQEVFEWTGKDGSRLEGVLTKPANFDPAQAHPLLVIIHGGPTWTSLRERLSGYERRVYPLVHWLARGAVILQPNYRGSSGYGEAFRRLNVRNLGLGDYEDVISGVDALIAQGWVDEERIGAAGWSQGGYIAAFITTYSDRFKAVSVGAGISDWMTYYVNTDMHPFTRQYLGATPWDDPEIYRSTSPISYVQNARTPTLIQHGEEDQRVPLPNAYELYQGLQDMGVPTRLVVQKGMAHGPRKPRARRQIMQENLDWFNRGLWGDAPAAASAPPCYVTLCSAKKRPEAGDLPAVERYQSSRIQDVYQQARRDDATFRIFSGVYGLLAPQDPVPFYDHMLALEDVSAMAARLAEQLRAARVERLVIFTGEIAQDPQILVYLGCLQVAAGAAGINKIEHREIKP